MGSGLKPEQSFRSPERPRIKFEWLWWLEPAGFPRLPASLSTRR
jgi:hypothetical protein